MQNQGGPSANASVSSNRTGPEAVVSQVSKVLPPLPEPFPMLFVANLCIQVLGGETANTAPTASWATLWMPTPRWLKPQNRALVVAVPRFL